MRKGGARRDLRSQQKRKKEKGTTARRKIDTAGRGAGRANPSSDKEVKLFKNRKRDNGRCIEHPKKKKGPSILKLERHINHLNLREQIEGKNVRSLVRDVKK